MAFLSHWSFFVWPADECAGARVAEEHFRHAVIEVADVALAHGAKVADEDAAVVDPATKHSTYKKVSV